MKVVYSTMMILAVLLVMLLSGCSREAPPTQTAPLPAPAPADDLVDALVHAPARLEAVQRQCREAPARVDAELCVAAGLAAGRRFRGDGQAKYTPEDVELFGESPPATQDE